MVGLRPAEGAAVAVLLCLIQAASCHSQPDFSESGTGVVADIPVFRWLSEGYKTFRIPGIVESLNWTLIAATEGRVSTARPPVGNASVCYGSLASRFDSRCVDKDIVVKLSNDHGDTWGPVRALTESNTTHFYSNPNMVLDVVTGDVWMVYYRCQVAEVYGHCTPLITSSGDNGNTWSTSRVVEAVKALHIGGLGGGIQLHFQKGSAQNRLILPHDGNGVIYSDDHGATWKVGNPVHGAGGENQAAELLDGTLQMSLRSGGSYSPTFCTSTDAGLTFTDCHVQKQLLSDNCQTSFLAIAAIPPNITQYSQRRTSAPWRRDKTSSQTVLLSAHPNSLNMVQPLGRQNLTLSVSHDNGETWHAAVTINPGPSAYTALAKISYKGRPSIACLYERSKDGPPVDFDTVAMAVIDAESLM